MSRTIAADRGESMLADIEEGIIKPFCYHCGHRQIRYVLVANKTDGGFIYPVKTKNKTGICPNPKCYRYTDMRQVKTWVRDDEILPNEQPMGATKSGSLV